MRYVEDDTYVYDPPCSMIGSDAPRTVLELGSGVGTAGLAAAAALHRTGLGHTVVLTDLAEVCPLLERNARTTQERGVDVRVHALPWGDAAAATDVQRALPRPITHVLCSDLVYFPELLAPLLRTLLDVTACTPSPEVVIGYKIRSLTKEQPFWAAFGAWFDFQVVYCAPATRPTAWAPLGSDAAHLAHGPPGQVPDDYFVFVAHRRPATLRQAPPASDAQLLQGFRVVEKEPHEVMDTDMSGVDTFEWLMLSRTMYD